jgi:hypothetical protein
MGLSYYQGRRSKIVKNTSTGCQQKGTGEFRCRIAPLCARESRKSPLGPFSPAVHLLARVCACVHACAHVRGFSLVLVHACVCVCVRACVRVRKRERARARAPERERELWKRQSVYTECFGSVNLCTHICVKLWKRQSVCLKMLWKRQCVRFEDSRLQNAQDDKLEEISSVHVLFLIKIYSFRAQLHNQTRTRIKRREMAHGAH